MTRKALGRGLDALLPEAGAGGGGPTTRDYFLCPIERIRPSKNQPRRFFDEERLGELVASILQHGVIQPLVVRPAQDGDFLLVAGERRWRAAQRAGLHDVPVVIREVSDQQAIEMALVENLQREDLNPVEEAQSMAHLIEEHGYTQEQLAERLGRDRTTVTNNLRLLKLPEAAHKALVAGSISAGHGRALLGLEEPRLIGQALKAVVSRSLSVRQTEALVKRLRAAPEGGQTAAGAARLSANVRDLQERLARSLKTPVKMRPGRDGRGRIEISYSSLDELDRLLTVLLR